ncbi:MAG: HD domain-containing phosphohydrolase [Acidobacteriota bacterium]
MHPEVDELRPKLKEILYDCAVEIRATKAALFIYDGSGFFELVTEYGFRGTIRESADRNDPMVDRSGRGRTAFFVNGMAAEPRFSNLLYESSTDRLLVAPLYSRGKLIGLIDMRDKPGKQLFDEKDLPKAQSIADRLVAVFNDKNLFGHRFISLSQVATPEETPAAAPSAPKPVTAPAEAPALAPQQAAPPAPARAQTRAYVPRLATLVLEARAAASRILVAPPAELLSESEIALVRDTLRAILLLPGAVAATFSAFGHMGGVQEIAARSTLGEEARNLIQSKLNVWLTKRGEGGGFVRANVTTPFGTSAPPLKPADVQKVFTAPLAVGALRGMYLTVVFSANPDRSSHELLGVLHNHVQLVIEQSLQRGAIQALQTTIAEKLIEPDFAKYPELRRHTDLVARLSESFARHLGMTPAETAQARIAALVHDCGMRLLDYDRLYRKPDPSAEEVSFLREHPVVGAALVEPLLGPEMARIVLCHHERVDGRGYPNELHGDEIPLVARLLQICDAWVAITDPDSYQDPESRESAMATLSRTAGEQFDAALVPRFIEMVRGMR